MVTGYRCSGAYKCPSRSCFYSLPSFRLRSSISLLLVLVVVLSARSSASLVRDRLSLHEYRSAGIISNLTGTEYFSSVDSALTFQHTCNSNTSVIVNRGLSKLSTLSFRLIAKRFLKQMLSPKQIQLTIKLSCYYFILYFFTVLFNVANKKVLESFPMPWTVASCQLIIGIPLFLPIWAWKFPFPNFSPFWGGRSSSSELSLVNLNKIAFCHGFGNVATVMALTSGSVSFVHVIKAAEPLFSAFLSVYFLHSHLSIWAYLSLIPIVIGVALASVKEMSFSWFVFGTAMLSNLLYMSRMVLSKASLQSASAASGTSSISPSSSSVSLAKQKSLLSSPPISAVNMFRLITLVASIQLIPCALLLERSRALSLWFQLQQHRPNEYYFVWTNLLMSGVSFYIYNEVAFWILDLVHPVTAAVGNSIKRIVLILASIIVFQTQVSELGWLGSAMAIGGSFAYALSQQWSHAAGSTILPVSSQVSSSSATSLTNLSTGTGEHLPPSEKYSL